MGDAQADDAHRLALASHARHTALSPLAARTAHTIVSTLARSTAAPTCKASPMSAVGSCPEAAKGTR